MLIGEDDIINDLSRFSVFVYIRARFHFTLAGENLTALSTWSHTGITGGIQIRETWLQALLPFQSALESLLAG